MNIEGNQRFFYVENVFKHAKSKPIYIIKSTILPGSTDRLSKLYPDCKIIFSLNF